MYPPMEIYFPIKKKEIYSYWNDYIESGVDNKIGLYIHIPFCRTKCNFCHCNSLIASNEKINAYLNDLKKEILYFSPLFKNKKISNIYFGGGTPSILSNTQLKDFLWFLFGEFNFMIKVPFCFEAMPETLDYEKIDILKNFGVSRLSLGVQSLNSGVLVNNNRIQDENNLYEIIYYVKNNIDFLNIDIVCGLEGETFESFSTGLKKIILLNPDIIHLYRFNPSETTNFSKLGKKYTQYDIDLREKMYQYGIKILLKSGRKKLRNDDFGFSMDARNMTIVERIENASSNIGFGYTARSNIFGKISYVNSGVYNENIYTNSSYIGYSYDLIEEKHRYVLQNLIDGLSFKQYKNIFGSDFLCDYGNKIKILINKFGKECIIVSDEEIKINFEKIDNIILNTIFFSRNVMNKIKEKYGNKS
ncbi:radical SAM protein [Candidatus Gracilibacteria bacterium]|nr:radical SAM protein [Candidatus Gracilibacteria bacterium]NUJ98859.1 radical SAM protein [Candidatus Gracilibacteria bacterium]